MAHGMQANDQMYSVRKAPWHQDETNSLVLDLAPETRFGRIIASGQNWTVEESDIFQAVIDEYNGPRTFIKLEGWKNLSRSDDKSILHVARDTYEVVQNVVGHELFEVLAAGARLDDGTGGTIGGGKRCYLSARLDEPVMVNGDTSPVYPYVVVTWTHDGSGAVQARRTSVRVVCWNTLAMSEARAKKAGRNFTFRHTKSILDRIEDAKLVISGAREETAAFIELSNELAAIAVSDDQREEFVKLFIPAPPTYTVISERVVENIAAARQQVRHIFDTETIPEAHRNTAYGLVQAGVEYLDHLRGSRSSDTYLGRTLLRDEPLKAKLVPMVRKLVSQSP